MTSDAELPAHEVLRELGESVADHNKDFGQFDVEK